MCCFLEVCESESENRDHMRLIFGYWRRFAQTHGSVGKSFKKKILDKNFENKSEVTGFSRKTPLRTLKSKASLPTVCTLFSCSNAYAVGKKEKPPFAPQEAPVVVQEEPIPNELLCLICHELLSDAVVIPCCGNSFCDDCESRQNTKCQHGVLRFGENELFLNSLLRYPHCPLGFGAAQLPKLQPIGRLPRQPDSQ